MSSPDLNNQSRKRRPSYAPNGFSSLQSRCFSAAPASYRLPAVFSSWLFRMFSAPCPCLITKTRMCWQIREFGRLRGETVLVSSSASSPFGHIVPAPVFPKSMGSGAAQFFPGIGGTIRHCAENRRSGPDPWSTPAATRTKGISLFLHAAAESDK